MGDGAVRYTDVPILNRSVMIEILSLVSPFRRIAGYAYALRSDGITDYERSGGVTLPFGKNRVSFSVATVPYNLEFFPKWGVKSGIISVYSGEPGPPLPPSGEWRMMPAGVYEMRLNSSPPSISYRAAPGSEAIVFGSDGAVEAVMIDSDVIWRTSINEYKIREVNTFYEAYPQSSIEFDAAISAVGSIVL